MLLSNEIVERYPKLTKNSNTLKSKLATGIQDLT